MFLLMLFMFCFFLGFVIMFFYLIRKIETQGKTLADDHAQIRVLLRALESRMDKLSQMEKINAMFKDDAEEETDENGQNAKGQSAVNDPLLHLSFEQQPNLNIPVNPGLDLNIDTTPTTLTMEIEPRKE